MDGTLTIIDGEPGRGKTLEAIRKMIASAKNNRNIITNVALKPEFIRRLRAKNYPTQIVRPTESEITNFWEHCPSNCDVYIDEAHLIWDSDMWKTNRISGFKSYISQFRKDGDSIWLLAQSYENLDKFIRQRATRLITCRRFSIPKFIPKIGGRPICFIVREWTTRDGERDEPSGLPRIYTSKMCADIYTLYDTRAKVHTSHATHSRKEWKDIMPEVLTAANTGNPVTIVNQTPHKKGHPFLFATILLIMGSVGYAAFRHQAAQNKLLTKIKKLATTQKQKPDNTINYYGAINGNVIISQHKKYAVWPTEIDEAGYWIKSFNLNGVMLHTPYGLHIKPWWHPKPLAKTSTHKPKKAKGLAHLGL